MTDPSSSSYTSPRGSRTRDVATAALLAALMAATSWIVIPFGPVPVTLQTAFVLLAALLLTPGWAAASISLYLLLGVAGLPVFAGGVGGPAGLVGPTAGFLIAFPVAALVGSALFHSLTFRKRRPAVELAIAVVAVLAAEGVIYVMGVSWLQWQANISLAKALSVALVPFIVPDALKATIAVVVAMATRRATGRR